MENIIADKDRIESAYADAIYATFKQIRYGIQTCSPIGNLTRLRARNAVVQWQSRLEENMVIETDIKLITDLPALYNGKPFYIGGLAGGVKTNVQIQYPSGDQDLIEINSNGCLTRVYINAGATQKLAYQYTQSTPASTWTIQHNLGFVPQVVVEDSTGQDVSGVISVMNESVLEIKFSKPISGKAYLS